MWGEFCFKLPGLPADTYCYAFHTGIDGRIQLGQRYVAAADLGPADSQSLPDTPYDVFKQIGWIRHHILYNAYGFGIVQRMLYALISSLILPFKT